MRAIGIAVTGTQSNFQAATQPGALFTADVYFTALESGAFNVDHWDSRNSMPEDNITTAPDGVTDYGDGRRALQRQLQHGSVGFSAHP